MKKTLIYVSIIMYFLGFYLFGFTSLILLENTLSKQWYFTHSDTSVSREFNIWDIVEIILIFLPN
jgi:hypothetical protein